MALFRNICTIFAAVMFILINNSSVFAQKVVYRFTIDQEIGPSMSKLTQKALAEAQRIKASYILLNLDTYGGAVDDADKIRTLLLKSKIPTLVFIKNNAASAGALISIACDSIYMASGSTIGAASVVNQTGELMPEKYQSYMRKKMRATAEETGRNPLIAEGMSDEKMTIDSIKAEGKIITLSVDEALKVGYCNAKVKDENEILKRLGEDYKYTDHFISSIDAFILFLLKPAVSGLLLLIVFGGIFLEFKAPGTFIPLGVSAIAAVFYFAPLYLEGLAANWEIAIFIIGLILLLVEIFLIPGFGVAGITGIIFVIAGLTLAMVRNLVFDFTFVPKGSFSMALFIVSLAIALPVILALFFGKSLFDSPIFKWTSVEPELNANDGFSVKESTLDALVGHEAFTETDLRPQGKIKIGDEYYDANGDGMFIDKHTKVKVIGIRANYLVVRPL